MFQLVGHKTCHLNPYFKLIKLSASLNRACPCACFWSVLNDKNVKSFIFPRILSAVFKLLSYKCLKIFNSNLHLARYITACLTATGTHTMANSIKSWDSRHEKRKWRLAISKPQKLRFNISWHLSTEMHSYLILSVA